MWWKLSSELIGQLGGNVGAVRIALGYSEEGVGTEALSVKRKKLRPSFCQVYRTVEVRKVHSVEYFARYEVCEM